MRRTILYSLPLAVVLSLMTWSYREGLAVMWRRPSLVIGVLSYHGKLRFVATDFTRDPKSNSGLRFARVPVPVGEVAERWLNDDPKPVRALGIEWRRQWNSGGSGGPRWYRRELVIPYWPIVTLSAVPLALLLRRGWRGHRWAMAGRCRVCGYDLRASPEQCPECGTPHIATT